MIGGGNIYKRENLGFLMVRKMQGKIKGFKENQFKKMEEKNEEKSEESGGEAETSGEEEKKPEDPGTEKPEEKTE